MIPKSNKYVSFFVPFFPLSRCNCEGTVDWGGGGGPAEQEQDQSRIVGDHLLRN